MVSITSNATVTIDREPADIWAFVSNVANQDHWVDGMSDSRLIGDEPIWRGSQVRGTYTYGGGSTSVLITITEFREGRRLGVESLEGPFPFTGLLSLERSGGGTSVSNAMTAGSDHVVTTIMFTLFRPLMKMMMGRQMKKELDQLRALLESGSANGSGDAG